MFGVLVSRLYAGEAKVVERAEDIVTQHPVAVSKAAAAERRVVERGLVVVDIQVMPESRVLGWLRIHHELSVVLTG